MAITIACKKAERMYCYFIGAFFLLFNFYSYAQVEKEYFFKCKLERKTETLLLFDTTVTLDYLVSDKDWYSNVINVERFHGFNYPFFKSAVKKKEVILFNDSIEFIISKISFDKIKLKKNLSINPDYYKEHRYYGTDEEIWNTKYLPKSEILSIKIKINDKIVPLSADVYENFFNPTLENIKIYLTDSNEMLLTMDNGSGTGAYIVILLFDAKGVLKRRVVQPVL